jgi:AraC family transcriptional regulator
MPERAYLERGRQSPDPGKVLRGGEFYSRVQSRLNTDDAVLCHLRQPGSLLVPRHEHALAYVTVVLDGHSVEGDHGKLCDMQPCMAVFNPCGIAHSTVIGPRGASFFTIEMREDALRQLDARLPECTTFDRGAGEMLWPGLRLYSAFRDQNADPLALEEHLLEMIGAIAGFEAAPRSEPRWFGRVKERLRAEFRQHPRVRELAREAGVHPVHLARTFRKFERQTPGDYQQRLRVRAACDLLRDPEWPLAVIAVECGFADQSHMTRIFHRMTASTPARFRRNLVT